jgi:hypothetical protein
MDKLFAVSVNMKTDNYGAPSQLIIVAAGNLFLAKEKVKTLIGKNQWISGAAEADHIFVMEKNAGIFPQPKSEAKATT